MLAPFIVSAANGGFYGALDVPQHLPAHVADGCAEGVNTVWGGKLVDGSEVVLVEPPGRLKSAAFQQRVGDADGGGRLELHLYPGFIIIHQQRTVNDGTDVPAVVVPVTESSCSSILCCFDFVSVRSNILYGWILAPGISLARSLQRA